MTYHRRSLPNSISRFSYYLRTGRILPEPKILDAGVDALVETKFNPYHDPRNGQFTFAPGGPKSLSHVVTSYGQRSGRQRATSLSSEFIIQSDGGELANEIVVIGRRQNDEPSYSLKSPTIRISGSIKRQVEQVAVEFMRHTGKKMVVTSGTRSAREQAAAMYDKFGAGASGSDYSNRRALREIKAAYVTGRMAGQDRHGTILAMEQVIERQIKNGVYISRHLIARAIDIRVNGLAAGERQALHDAVRKAGGKVHPEGRPPHLHVQF
ncbi:hypothetical protein [Sphingobium fluviale]|uniref:Uncharacterized protein n=1 Tax=Sphingobium fluviale TaxID=2506423 RepID=A0A4Q1KEG4_9SPHN|nr:hypothetical protein [Sphingobium fluviale]RXR25586.1 hypothetical protein EQG66_13830 [Sphingobium fluviale]